MDARIYGAKVMGRSSVDGCVFAPEDELEWRRNARKRGRLSKNGDPEAVAAASEQAIATALLSRDGERALRENMPRIMVRISAEIVITDASAMRRGIVTSEMSGQE